MYKVLEQKQLRRELSVYNNYKSMSLISGGAEVRFEKMGMFGRVKARPKC